jgi:hypothetical protein
MNASCYFQRREDYQPPKTPRKSPFRKFTVRCLACDSYQLRLVAQFDEATGEMEVVLVCTRCPQREKVPVK